MLIEEENKKIKMKISKFRLDYYFNNYSVAIGCVTFKIV